MEEGYRAGAGVARKKPPRLAVVAFLGAVAFG
jgi:hypothetical protein